MISYEEARELVRRTLEPGWQEGTFCLDDREIVENDASYVIRVGPREYLVDGDESYLVGGEGVPVVSKQDGTITWEPWVVLMDSPGLTVRTNPSPTLQA
jgi:hypothetical protein